MDKVRAKRVVVAMSGGVDSSVAAALLKRAGFDVVGIFMKFWKDGSDGKNRCCSVESEKLARMVAKKIGIPFYVVNAEKEFKKKVVDYFLKEYKKGNTPNPCVVCNKEIKFGFLIKKALSLGADYVATGHYASLGYFAREAQNNFKSRAILCDLKFSFHSAPTTGRLRESILLAKYPRLFAAKDKEKDQSYFLWQLSQKQLGRVLFPVGGYTKAEVRKLAKKFGLPTAKTPESQEVCFVQNTTDEFLKKYLKIKPGDTVDVSGKKIGAHNGLWFYTIGQRRGIGLSGGPFYVIDKDFKKNYLIVSDDKKDLLKKELAVKNINWAFKKAPKMPIRCQVKIRYRTKSAPAVINKNKIIFNKPQRAVTPGQSAVFYSREKMLGGGVIVK